MQRHHLSSINHHLRGRSGLTLPEVLLSAVIISVAVLALVGLFPTALQNVQYGGHMSQASSLAQEVIELIRTRPFVDIPLYNNLDTGVAPAGLPVIILSHYRQWCRDIVYPDPAWCVPSAPDNPGGALPQGRGTITVTPIDLPPADGFPDLFHVTITINWQERGNQSVTLETYVAPHG